MFVLLPAAARNLNFLGFLVALFMYYNMDDAETTPFAHSDEGQTTSPLVDEKVDFLPKDSCMFCSIYNVLVSLCTDLRKIGFNFPVLLRLG